MPEQDPLQLFTQDRQRARAAEDPMAHLCTVANTDSTGQAQVRTLVLREADEQLAIFVNATSPKWPLLQQQFAVLTYWPSIQIQYRLQVLPRELTSDLVHESWQLRPDPPKRMDWFYEQKQEQSSPIGSRELLLAQLQQVELPEPLQAPANARGLLLDVQQLERLDLTQPDGVHRREIFTRQQQAWHHQMLVP